MDGPQAGGPAGQATAIRLLNRLERSLPSHYYWAPAVYEQEKERLFYRKWLCAGREEELARPGEFVLRQVADESVLLVRDNEGAIRGFYNVCRHRGARLATEAEGCFPRHGITCPYHGWTYALDGRLQGTPHMVRMPDFAKPDYPLHPIQVTVWEGFVFLSLAAEPIPLQEQMEGLWTHFARYRLQALRRATRVVYDVAANWKLLIENFTECFHCPHIHPELDRVTPYLAGGAAEREGARAWRGGHWMELAEGCHTLTVTGEKHRPNLSGISPEDRSRVYYNTLYPNFFLSLHPDYVLTHTLWPAGPERTRLVCEWLFEPETMATGDFDPRDTVEFWDLVNRQDFRVCELAHQGNRSRAHPHGVHVAQESGPQHFTRYIQAELRD
ncbi:MAG TPA: aromatic ring-hydroxylating dioxygenase subunit alpha [Methylomirabilota bacterium]|nr:aromatic ring-hydroxylating dioxygenase subunit alpha [Methylomirabilota bacterium]